MYVSGASPTEAPRVAGVGDSAGTGGHDRGAAARLHICARLARRDARRACRWRQEQGIWIWDLTRKTLTRLTDTPAFYANPVWTPDSRRVIFASSLGGIPNLFWRAADNTGIVERLTTSPNAQVPTSIAPDGTRLVVREIVPATGADLRVLRLEGPSQTEPLLQTPFNENSGEISPDGHWLAYESNDSGPIADLGATFPERGRRALDDLVQRRHSARVGAEWSGIVLSRCHHQCVDRGARPHHSHFQRRHTDEADRRAVRTPTCSIGPTTSLRMGSGF